MYLPNTATAAQRRDADNARRNRQEFIKALSHGQISRRDLLRTYPSRPDARQVMMPQARCKNAR